MPKSVDELLANNDVALYDLQNDSEEMENLANANSDKFDRALLDTMNAKLNALIEAEIGEDEALFAL